MIYYCCQENRRNLVDAHPTLNGIDYLEVLDRDAPVGSPRQRTLMLHLLKAVPASLTEDKVHILGGERVRDPKIEWVRPADDLAGVTLNAGETAYLSGLADAGKILIIRTESEGDFSDYCLILRDGASEPPQPSPGFDPRLSEITFSFKVECPSEFDCLDVETCPEEVASEPDINYLAKDYASFRQLVLDRMSYLMPGWKSRSPADLGVTLAELIAYKGDELSYWQDAVTTEAYLNTARKRISLRRHALLVDYRISEGRNARSWLHIKVAGGPVDLADNVLQFLTRVDGLGLPADGRFEPDSKQHASARAKKALVFEMLQDQTPAGDDSLTENYTLYDDHNKMKFYTWGDDNCCLPRGATSATLASHHPNLVIADGFAGQYLLFEEVIGPNTGEPEDANPEHRQLVRLIRADLSSDPLDGTEITNIYWHAADALKFPLCISSQQNTDPDSPLPITDVSIARGNMVLADHGETISENLGTVPEPWLYFPMDKDSGSCDPGERVPIPPRYRPRLGKCPLSNGAMAPVAGAPAAGSLVPALEKVNPLVTKLAGDEGTLEIPWSLRPDLLNSDDEANHVVVELDNDGAATLRFGDDDNGARPESGTEFTISYRVGNGTEGNVGAGSIRHIVSNNDKLIAVYNPLPAQGGLVAETPAQIRRRAPQAFRRQLRAVTPEDYADFTTTLEGVQQAAATPRWTGSWHTQTITVDREGGLPLDQEFETRLAAGIERYRMAGHELNFNDPVFVSLQLELLVCVSRDYFRSNVKQALLEVFNSGRRPDGNLGLFHPDTFSFGQTIYLSPIYAAARQVRGVSSVQITRFSCVGDDDPKPLSDRFIRLGRLEIPRLENNPNFPEHGVLKLTMLGGK
jgi:hypothetical protein